jgi:hypothetical protein
MCAVENPNFPKNFRKNFCYGIDPPIRMSKYPLYKGGYGEGGPPTYGYREVYPVISPLCILRSHEPYENINISIWYNETNVISLSSKSNDMKKTYNRMFNVGMTLVSVCSLLLFLGFLVDDGSIQLDSSYNWIGTLWTMVFLFGVLLILISVPNTDSK